MRLDKFLKVSRLIKRRTVANSACDLERVFVNGKAAKPAHQLKIGDTIKIEFGSGIYLYEVKALTEKASKEDAAKMYAVKTADSQKEQA